MGKQGEVRIKHTKCPRCAEHRLTTDGDRVWCSSVSCSFGENEGEPVKLEIPSGYKIESDSIELITQSDWDGVQKAFQEYGKKREMLKLPPEDEVPTRGLKFQLALYPNPMRPGECFIAEAKDIEPEPLTSYQGRPLYAPVPKTQWILPSNIPIVFAIELVRRWNRPQGPASI